jgi:predicted outer membrane protein
MGMTARLMASELVLLGGLAAFGAGRAEDGAAPALKPSELVPALHQINQIAVKAGDLASDHGSSQALKDFGQWLARDHRAADDGLVTLAQNLGLAIDGTLPAAIAANLQRARDELDVLRSVSGPEFDRRFALAMVTDHKYALRLIEASRPQITEARLQTHLAIVEQELRDHERAASRLAQGTSAGDAAPPPSSKR